MNKLTEIKEALSKITTGRWELKGEAVYCDTPTEYEPICQLYANSERDFVNCEYNGILIANAPEYITYLISLLEEKDKALAMLADKKNWTRRWTENSAELVWIWTEDGSPHEVAQAAYTSSNNEGD
ncbi:hypothetical protein [Paenibacillus sp. FSL R10-2771]|uniref:hypothetical protein n=1 Tax=Paenibacillus sp. FSL R10-2771 TaxID=2954693 RepID=UPI0030FB0D3C